MWSFIHPSFILSSNPAPNPAPNPKPAGDLGLPCSYLVSAFRNVDGVLNARCALSAMPLDASGREDWDGPLTSHTDDGFSSCLIHSDCPVGRFCGLVNAPDASASACMSCTHCCAAQMGLETDELFHMPMYGSEPGCGHCQVGCLPLQPFRSSSNFLSQLLTRNRDEVG